MSGWKSRIRPHLRHANKCMILRTYERYSMTGGNRLTLSVSILAVGDRMEVALTTSGGSQGVFLKFNTFGEGAFMDKGLEAVDSFPRG